MVIRLTPGLEQIVEDKLKSGRFETAEEVIGQALRALHEKEQLADDAERKAKQREAVEKMLAIAQNPAPLDGVSIKDLIHEGHRI
ncbi:MAG: ribbon-helix-helix domain-containing protein [Candidatus Acidiferrales bacterium]